jgi:hypothetical protein
VGHCVRALDQKRAVLIPGHNDSPEEVKKLSSITAPHEGHAPPCQWRMSS